jgi:hypothetical protein
MNKKIPTSLALVIIVICSVVAGGIVLWQVSI